MEKKEIIGYARITLRAVFVHPIQLAWRGSPGAERFRANFLPEGLVPTSADDREHLRQASRCIGCGLCNAPAMAGGLGQLPSLVPLVFSRSSVELPQSREAIALLRANESVLEAGERLCPTRVPLRELTRWLSERLTRVDAAEAGQG
jgi:ferredoxin